MAKKRVTALFPAKDTTASLTRNLDVSRCCIPNPLALVPAVYPCFSVKEPIKGFSTLAGGMRIYPLVYLRDCIE
jgi:hypothetical protein